MKTTFRVSGFSLLILVSALNMTAKPTWAEEPASAPTKEAPPSADPSQAPQGPSPSSEIRVRLLDPKTFRATSAGGGLGGTEEGFALQGHATFDDNNGNWVKVKGTVGAPLLQGGARGELGTVDLHRITVPAGQAGEVDIGVDAILLSGDLQLQVPLPGQTGNSRLIADPKIAATVDWLSPEQLKMAARIRATAGPAGGVVHDGDGTSGLFGIQVGVQTQFSYAATDKDELDFLCGIEAINAVHSGFNGPATRSQCELGYTRGLGDDGALRVALTRVSDNFDIEGKQDGNSSFTGITATFTLPSSQAAKGN
jgi:hypothetical protein